MKSDIFISAITNRFQVKFLYKFKFFVIEPYFITQNRFGKKVIYGRINNTNEIMVFEYKNISNIRILNKHKFSPIIPLLPA